MGLASLALSRTLRVDDFVKSSEQSGKSSDGLEAVCDRQRAKKKVEREENKKKKNDNYRKKKQNTTKKKPWPSNY